MNKDHAVGFAIGFLAGAVIGGVIALLYAPKSGKETRAIIKGKVTEVAHSIKEKTIRVVLGLIVIKGVFEAGQIGVTEGVYDLAGRSPDFTRFIQKSLNRHVEGDWGDLDDGDKRNNDRALKKGSRLRSAYNDDRFPENGGTTIWIITEADRSATTVLFPDEYLAIDPVSH